MRFIFTILILPLAFISHSGSLNFKYDSNAKAPFGLQNPDAPKALDEYKLLIGESICKSVRRIDQNTWGEPEDMKWRFKYIMNGMAIQDETLKATGIHTGSVRQYDEESKIWQVHYYNLSATNIPLPNWVGGKDGDRLEFKREHISPKGIPGDFVTSFYDISNEGFNWIGEWKDHANTIVYPTLKITCKKD